MSTLMLCRFSQEMFASKAIVALVVLCLSVQAVTAGENMALGPRKLLAADVVSSTDVYAEVDMAARAEATEAAQYCNTQWCYWVTCRNARKAIGYCSRGRCYCE